VTVTPVWESGGRKRSRTREQALVYARKSRVKGTPSSESRKSRTRETSGRSRTRKTSRRSRTCKPRKSRTHKTSRRSRTRETSGKSKGCDSSDCSNRSESSEERGTSSSVMEKAAARAKECKESFIAAKIKMKVECAYSRRRRRSCRGRRKSSVRRS
jgi:hypothetical protein